MKIGFISFFDPKDRFASSGTCYKMAEQLSKIGEVVWIRRELTARGRWLQKFQHYFNRLVKNHKLLVHLTKLGENVYSIKNDLHLLDDVDVIVGFFCSAEIAKLDVDKPIIYFSDATFASMIDYYPDFSNLFDFNIRYGLKSEKRMLQNSDVVVYSSDWAAKSAIESHGVPADKIKVVEFGPNIDDEDIPQFQERGESDSLNLLFLGVDWGRKGGDIAVKVVEALNGKGVEANLYVVGIRDLSSDVANLPFVRNIGFLNKNLPHDYNRLIEIVKECDALLLPTLNECAGIAFVESSAYGLPVFTHDTGGVANYVINGVNGYRLPVGSAAEAFADAIIQSKENGELKAMSKKAYDLYRNKLNWTNWRRQIEDIIRGLIQPAR